MGLCPADSWVYLSFISTAVAMNNKAMVNLNKATAKAATAAKVHTSSLNPTAAANQAAISLNSTALQTKAATNRANTPPMATNPVKMAKMATEDGRVP